MTQANELIRKRGEEAGSGKFGFLPQSVLVEHMEENSTTTECWHGKKSIFHLAFPQLSSDTGYWFWWTCGMNHSSCCCLYPYHSTRKVHTEAKEKENKIGKCEVLIRMFKTARVWHDWLLRTLKYRILSKLLKNDRNVKKSICILKML